MHLVIIYTLSSIFVAVTSVSITVAVAAAAVAAAAAADLTVAGVASTPTQRTTTSEFL